MGFLIEFLTARRTRRYIFINCPVANRRNDLATLLCNKLNYKKILVDDLFKESKDVQSIKDSKLNETVLKAIDTTEKHYRGIIISGYP